MTPTETNTQLVITAPEPVTLTPPDLSAIVARYNTDIAPLLAFRIETNAQYVTANQLWSKAKDYCADVEALCEPEKKRRNKLHKDWTSLEKALLDPGTRVSKHMGDEILRYKQEQDRIQREREERERLAEVEKRRIEQAAIDAEHARVMAEREAAKKDLDPWEVEDETPAPVAVVLPPVAPVRMPSTVPVVAGGPRVADTPWKARITDPVALLKWVLEKPEERIAEYVEFRMPRLNTKCGEFGTKISSVIPGVVAEKDQILKRG